MSKEWEKFLDKTAAREMKRLERAADSQLYFVRDAQNNEEAHMTYEEAAELLEYGESEEAIYLAIEALEKQIPKKPKEKTTMLMCPTCNKPFSSKHYAHEGYCKHCGQHISDWSEVE